MDAVRLHKTGFPEHLSYSEFWRKFHILEQEDEEGGSKSHSKTPAPGEMRAAVEDLLAYLEMDKSTVRMGNTQVGKILKYLFKGK